jgi:hypothetical protein
VTRPIELRSPGRLDPEKRHDVLVTDGGHAAISARGYCVSARVVDVDIENDILRAAVKRIIPCRGLTKLCLDPVTV